MQNITKQTLSFGRIGNSTVGKRGFEIPQLNLGGLQIHRNLRLSGWASHYNLHKVLACFVCVMILTTCGKQPKKIVLQGLAQGSYYAVTYYDEQNRDFQREIDSIFHAVDLSVNLWVDSSVISKVNRNEKVVLDSTFIDNFNIAQQAAALSDGYFDPTISPIVAAWGFSYKSSDSLTPQLIDSLRTLVDYQKCASKTVRSSKKTPTSPWISTP
jgi:thiamine biosynthesis lipoprotein